MKNQDIHFIFLRYCNLKTFKLDLNSLNTYQDEHEFSLVCFSNIIVSRPFTGVFHVSTNMTEYRKHISFDEVVVEHPSY